LLDIRLNPLTQHQRVRRQILRARRSTSAQKETSAVGPQK
jgi:hypothetical protein